MSKRNNNPFVKIFSTLAVSNFVSFLGRIDQVDFQSRSIIQFELREEKKKNNQFNDIAAKERKYNE